MSEPPAARSSPGEQAAALSSIRVMIIDDHSFFRASLSLLLSDADDVEVVGCCPDVSQGLVTADSARPDVVLMDLDMPVQDGVVGVLLFRATFPDLPVLILTGTGAGSRHRDATDAGARAVLTKDLPPDRLIDAIRVAAGSPGGR
jgi:two-component system, NarL family, response regulator DegU